MKTKRRTRPWWQLLIAKLRLWWGFCPECNSSAPHLYACPTCEYYTQPYPPSAETKARWWTRYREPVCQHGRIWTDKCPDCTEMLHSLGANARNPRRG